MDSACLFLGAVALELVPGNEPERLRLAPRDADAVAAGVANDLARLVPETAALDLALGLALFDPAELLRPRWPVQAALAALAERAPGERGGRVLALGMADGRMPDPSLEPDPALAGGPLRLLPWALSGPAEAIAATGARLEELLLERGMADAATALALQDAFGARLEHVRHATLHDLCALTAAQYRHAALGGAWSVLEDALLHAAGGRFTAEDGPPVLFTGSEVLLGTLDRAAFDAAAADRPEPAAAGSDPDRAFGYWRMRERQLRAVFEAHGLAVQAVPLARLAGAEATLRAAAPPR